MTIHIETNNQKYLLNNTDMTATILKSENVIKLEIFPTITVNDKTYEVKFPDNCHDLFNNNLCEFKLNKLLHPTTNIKSCCCMFHNCKSLQSLDLSNLDTSNVTNFSKMFHNCISLKHINVSSFNTSKVTDMSCMFKNCLLLKELDLSSFNTENVIKAYFMFAYCELLEKVNVSSFNTKNMLNMGYMFGYCNNIKELQLSNFYIQHNCNIHNMFDSCKKLKQINVNINNKCINNINNECIISNGRIYKYIDIIFIHNVKNPSNYIYDINCNNSYK